MFFKKQILKYFWEAINAAQQFNGNTSPNPCVGAAVFDSEGKVLSIAAHEKAGTLHAERKAIELCKENGTLHRALTLWVTLEPCCHFGRTPPCTEAILESPIRHIIYGCIDPNPVVAGKGIQKLKNAGLNIYSIREWAAQSEETKLQTECLELEFACQELIQSFQFKLQTSLPWLTIKTAHQVSSLPLSAPDAPRNLPGHIPQGFSPFEELSSLFENSMIPPKGQKTFTSKESITLAHRLRKQSDAIITGASTVIADSPLFTVREVPDFTEKRRILAIMNRTSGLPENYSLNAKARKLDVQVYTNTSPLSVLQELTKQNVMQVLLEAGPTLTKLFLKSGLWNEYYQVFHFKNEQSLKEPDQVVKHRNENFGQSSKKP